MQINKSQKIAQLLLLPYYQIGKNLDFSIEFEDLESSDPAFGVQEIPASRPLTDLYWPSSG